MNFAATVGPAAAFSRCNNNMLQLWVRLRPFVVTIIYGHRACNHLNKNISFQGRGRQLHAETKHT
jgi:hypothetical protein